MLFKKKWIFFFLDKNSLIIFSDIKNNAYLCKKKRRNRIMLTKNDKIHSYSLLPFLIPFPLLHFQVFSGLQGWRFVIPKKKAGVAWLWATKEEKDQEEAFPDSCRSSLTAISDSNPKALSLAWERPLRHSYSCDMGRAQSLGLMATGLAIGAGSWYCIYQLTCGGEQNKKKPADSKDVNPAYKKFRKYRKL